MDEKDSSENWSDCRPGELGEMVRRLRNQQSRRRIGRGALATAALVLLFAAVLSFADWPRSGSAGELNCQQVVQLEPQYRDGTLDPASRRKVERHLQKCGSCRTFYREAQERALAGLEDVLSLLVGAYENQFAR